MPLQMGRRASRATKVEICALMASVRYAALRPHLSVCPVTRINSFFHFVSVVTHLLVIAVGCGFDILHENEHVD